MAACAGFSSWGAGGEGEGVGRGRRCFSQIAAAASASGVFATSTVGRWLKSLDGSDMLKEEPEPLKGTNVAAAAKLPLLRVVMQLVKGAAEG